MISVVSSTGSTNADLAARLRGGEALEEGFWLVADRQTAGRGRQGRGWNDGAGNYMGSTLVRLRPGDPPAQTLALVAGLAVHAAVAPRLPPPAALCLKWPNDAMIGPAKLAGVLLEREGDVVIAGIGVNLARAPAIPGRDTVALSAFGPAPDRDLFAADLARVFADELADWRRLGQGETIRRWLQAAHPPGTPLVATGQGEEPVRGTFAGLSADGALQLVLEDGTRQTIHAGEVRLAP